MAFRAVLDACVLYPASLRDTLLRMAALELYDPLWSARILDEAIRNLIEDQRMTPEGARRMTAAMTDIFEAAEVPADKIARLEPAMTNHRKDRHVLATAVAADAEAVITSNLLDFPASACEPAGVEALHPDEFLGVLYTKAPQAVLAEVRRQAADLHNPPMTLSDVLGALSLSVPRFAATLRGSLSDDDLDNDKTAKQ